MGELKGFPGAVNNSRIWRIEPGTLHARCGTDAARSVLAGGLTLPIGVTVDKTGQVYAAVMNLLPGAQVVMMP